MPTIKLELSYEQAELLRQICEVEAAWENVYTAHEHELLVATEAQLQNKLTEVVKELAKEVYGQC